MVSLLDHLALIHHQDELGVTDRAQPVGHDHLRATAAGEVLNHPLFGVGIQGEVASSITRMLGLLTNALAIKPLALPPRGSGRLHSTGCRSHRAGRAPHRGFRHRGRPAPDPLANGGIPQAEVVAHAATEQLDVLLHHGQRTNADAAGDAQQRLAVEQNGAAAGLVQPGDQLGQGAFAAAAAPHQGNRIPGCIDRFNPSIRGGLIATNPKLRSRISIAPLRRSCRCLR